MEINELASAIRDIYGNDRPLNLHEPQFSDRDCGLVMDALRSTFVSSVGEYITKFEQSLSKLVNGMSVTAVVNGTSALHTCLRLSGVRAGDLVLTQSLTFVATCNAIRYCDADPVFIDVDRETASMCPIALAEFLQDNARISGGEVIHRDLGRRIRAVMPMHTFGHPAKITEISDVCRNWGLMLIEDAAEGLGSKFNGIPVGSFGDFAAISFNGNKIITTGGGGAVVSKQWSDGNRAKHITTTAKVPHRYEFIHDEVGFNYRMPNLNAALGCAQLEKLDGYLYKKREIAQRYKNIAQSAGLEFFDEPLGARSNFWLNAVVCKNVRDRELLLDGLEKHDIYARPVWKPMHSLEMYKKCPTGPLPNTDALSDQLLCLPSSPRSINDVGI